MCGFITVTIDYDGHVIRPRRLKIAARTTDTNDELTAPTNIAEHRSFLWLCNIFCRFVPIFACIEAPHNRKINKGQDTPHCIISGQTQDYARLQKKLVSPPILALPDIGCCSLDIDACKFQYRWLFIRKQPDGTVNLLGYWSRSLTTVEQAYETTQHKYLAIVCLCWLYTPILKVHASRSE